VVIHDNSGGSVVVSKNRAELPLSFTKHSRISKIFLRTGLKLSKSFQRD
jgi:hypothetical protein|tara:strand:- start:72 stop:218 length:147 start_codon:yes stop_codon:yes gene_type:complete